jgi:ribosomal protein RSM22 (predicted rRNA methylase)
MQIPFELKNKINSLIEGISLNELTKERKNLTLHYRERGPNSPLNSLSTDKQRLSYLLTRLPATFAAIHQVLLQLKEPVYSLLDLGAGPGTALLAALEAGLSITKATLIERDPGFAALGRSLLSFEARWLCQDLKKDFTLEPHDLVIASYSLGELREKDRMDVLEKFWQCTEKFLVIIEPGTKAAFESLMQMRQALIEKGAHLIAPCPHSQKCPNDWCHFSARVERSSFHRKMKEGTLNYEDEKFCYVIFSKKQIEPCQARVLRAPQKESGYIKLQLCTKEGITEKRIPKMKIKWGDELK